MYASAVTMPTIKLYIIYSVNRTYCILQFIYCTFYKLRNVNCTYSIQFTFSIYPLGDHDKYMMDEAQWEYPVLSDGISEYKWTINKLIN